MPKNGLSGSPRKHQGSALDPKEKTLDTRLTTGGSLNATRGPSCAAAAENAAAFRPLVETTAAWVAPAPVPETCYKVQVAGHKPEIEQPWGISKEGQPQLAPLWSFQGGVQRGEIEIPPLVSFLGVWGAIFSTRKRWSPEIVYKEKINFNLSLSWAHQCGPGNSRRRR